MTAIFNVTLGAVPYDTYVARGYVRTRFDIDSAGAIEFLRVPGGAPGTGGIYQIYRAGGITTIQDGGAGGVRIAVYNPTTNVVILGPDNFGIVLHTNYMEFFYNSACYLQIDVNGLTVNSPLLAKAVGLDDISDFVNIDWAAAAAPGVKWITSDVLAPAVVAGRGGIYRKSTNSVTPSWWKGCQVSYSAQDGYRLYTRFAMQQIANCRFAVGFADDVPAAGANTLSYVDDAVQIVQDDVIGANYLLRTRVGGAAFVDVDTTIPVVAGESHRFVLNVAPDRVATLYIDEVLRATAVLANCPLATTLLRKVIYADNIGGGALAELDIDCFIPVEARNLAVTV